MSDAVNSTPAADSVPPEAGTAATEPRSFTLTHWTRRALARIIDYLGLVIIGAVVAIGCSAAGVEFFTYMAYDVDGTEFNVPNGGTGFGIYSFLGLLYSAAQVVWTGLRGLTIGKKLVGIKAVREQDAQVLGVPKAFLRAVAKTVVAVVSLLLAPFSAIFWLLNYGWAIFDKQRQPVTDKLLRVVVIDVPKSVSSADDLSKR